MPTTHVALLRGINVGTAKRVAMEDLRRAFESLKHQNVRTLLNSGNVVFTSPRPLGKNVATTLENVIEQKLGVSCRVIVLGAAELDSIVADFPFAHLCDDPSRMLVYAMRSAADATKLRPLRDQDFGRERFALGRRWAYLWCADGILDGALAKACSRAVGESGTSRNWNTMLKLHALVQSAE